MVSALENITKKGGIFCLLLVDIGTRPVEKVEAELTMQTCNDADDHDSIKHIEVG